MLKATKYINVYTCWVTAVQWSDTNTNTHDIAKMNNHIALRSSNQFPLHVWKSVGPRKPVSQAQDHQNRSDPSIFCLDKDGTKLMCNGRIHMPASFILSSQITGRLAGITCITGYGFLHGRMASCHYRYSIKKIQNSLSEWANLLFQTTKFWASHIPSM